MRTVTYKSVLDRIASYLGEADGLDTEDKALAEAKVNLFVRLGWEHFPHPETTSIEQRTFRPVWVTGTTAAAKQEFYDNASGQYYVSLHDANTVAPTTQAGSDWQVNPDWGTSAATYSGDDWASGTTYNQGAQVRDPSDGNFYQLYVTSYGGGTPPAVTPSAWGLLVPFIRSIAYNQVALNGTPLTPIGQVITIWDRDPTVAQEGQLPALPIGKRLRATYIQVLGAANVVWVEFQNQAPVFSGVTRSDAATYVSGTEAYDGATGDYWIANQAINAGESPTSAPQKWNRVQFPYYLAEFVAQSAYVQLTDREQEQPENFSVQLAAGYPLLVAEMDHIERRQGQTRQLNVRLGRR